MEKTKITKTMVLTAIEGYFAQGEQTEVIAKINDVDITAADIVEYATKTIEQIAKKTAKAAETRAKKAIENDEFLEVVFGLVTDEPQTGEDILAQIDVEDMTIAKVRARLSKLVQAERIVKEPIKVEGPDGKTLKRMAYTLPTATAEEE